MTIDDYAIDLAILSDILMATFLTAQLGIARHNKI